MCSLFNNWIKLTNQFSTDDENEKYSHLLLNGIYGGKLYVKKENMNIFFKKYSDAIINNEYIYVVESRENLFPLFFDLDFKLDDNIWNENKDSFKIFKEIFVHIYDVVKLFYKEEDNILLIITDAEIKYVSEPSISDKIIKKGFHLHFPDIIVSKNTALEIRKMCVSKLKTIYGKTFINTFSDIVDETVFVKNGLRLTGSRKGSFRNISANKREFEDEGRPYKLLYVYNNNKIDDNLIHEFNLNYLKLIENTTITNYKNREETIKSKLELDISDETCYQCDEESDNSDNESKNLNGNSNDWIKIPKSDIVYTEIVKFFSNNVKDYLSKDIKRIFCSDDKNVYIIWTKSKYCQNIGRNHNSCGIYFKLTKQGICQKCFCKCDTQDGRKYGYCHSFSSTLIPCTVHIKKLLNFKENKDESNDTQLKSFVLKSKELDVSGSMNDLRNLLYNSFTNKSPIKQKGKGKGKEKEKK